MSFYYFVASLPALALEAPAPMRLDEFRAEAARLLPADAVRELEAVLAGRAAQATSDFARRWFAQATQIRNAVAAVRAGRRGVEAAPHLRPHAGFSAYLDQAVAEAYGKPHPLERERALDRLRWEVLDELVRPEPFGLAAVLAYGLKLGLAERWTPLTDEAGRAALLDTVKRVREAGAARAVAEAARS